MTQTLGWRAPLLGVEEEEAPQQRCRIAGSAGEEIRECNPGFSVKFVQKLARLRSPDMNHLLGNRRANHVKDEGELIHEARACHGASSGSTSV